MAGNGAPLVIVNGQASGLRDPGRRRSIVDGVVAAVLDRTGLDAHVVDGTVEEAQAALAAARGAPIVVTVGGDGTVRGAAAALAGSATLLAIVPGGTGNVLASTFGLGGVDRAIRTIRGGAGRRIDIGHASWGAPGASEPTGSEVFIVAVGTGLDAKVMAGAQGEWKRRLRFGAYIGSALAELARLETADFTITADGETFTVHGHVALVANAGDLIPGRLGPREPIDPTDGWLDVLVVTGDGLLSGLRGAAELLLRSGHQRGGHQRGAAVRRPAKEVRIETVPAQPVELDGDPHGPGWLSARIEPAALSIIVPDR